MMPPEAPGNEPLDPRILANLRKLEAATGEIILPQLLASFATVTPARLAVLREAIAAGDARTVEQGAHTLKGSSANLGALQMAQLCSALELLGQTSNLAQATSLLAQIECAFENARTALEHALAQD